MAYENALDKMYQIARSNMTPEEVKAADNMTRLYNEAVRNTCDLREKWLFGGGSILARSENLLKWEHACEVMLSYAYSHGWTAYESTGGDISEGCYEIEAFIPTRLIKK